MELTNFLWVISNLSRIFRAPFRGMDLTVDNNAEYAKYIQIMLIGHNNKCSLRYGTRLIEQFPFDPNKICRSHLAVMSHLGDKEK